MRRATILCIVFVAMFVLASAEAAKAGYQVISGMDWGPYQSGSGGEFTLQAAGSPSSLNWVLNYYTGSTKNLNNGTTNTDTFQTFCLEHGEYINKNNTYDARLNSAAVNGGVDGPRPDPISVGTAYLYSLFASEKLDEYRYGGGEVGRKQDAATLQNAIWYLEQEINIDNPTGANKYLQLVSTVFGGLDKARLDNNGKYNVMVLNLTQTDKYGNITKCQDMLVATPIPGAVWLLGSGLLGLVGFRKRFSAN